MKSKWGETEALNTCAITITRNNADFYTTHGINHALDLLDTLKSNDHPIGFCEYEFDKKLIGRKVWWKEQKAVVKRYIKGQAAVILVPDPEIGKFTCPPSYVGDGMMWDDLEDSDSVKEDVFSRSIYWFRD